MSRILRCHSLWKSVEDFSCQRFGRESARSLLESVARVDSSTASQPLRACSACAGDYEDPDRTAWGPDAEEDESGEEHTRGDEFPAP
jgi:hypothetical protein